MNPSCFKLEIEWLVLLHHRPGFDSQKFEKSNLDRVLGYRVIKFWFITLKNHSIQILLLFECWCFFYLIH